jgi:bacterioferritin-associated ferredoxin
MVDYTEKSLEASLEEIVCWCSNVSKRTILHAIHDGATTIDEIRRTTGACTVGRFKELSPRGRCCSMEIMKLLNQN